MALSSDETDPVTSLCAPASASNSPESSWTHQTYRVRFKTLVFPGILLLSSKWVFEFMPMIWDAYTAHNAWIISPQTLQLGKLWIRECFHIFQEYCQSKHLWRRPLCEAPLSKPRRVPSSGTFIIIHAKRTTPVHYSCTEPPHLRCRAVCSGS